MTRKEFDHKAHLVRYDLCARGYATIFTMKYLPQLEEKLDELDETWEKR